MVTTALSDGNCKNGYDSSKVKFLCRHKNLRGKELYQKTNCGAKKSAGKDQQFSVPGIYMMFR
jgi:hypothetical protein